LFFVQAEHLTRRQRSLIVPPGDLICATVTLITVPTSLTFPHLRLSDPRGTLIVVPSDLIRATVRLITVPTSLTCSLLQLIAAPRTSGTPRTFRTFAPGTLGTTKC